MSIFSIFFFFFLHLLLFKPSHSTTLIVDGSSEWKNPTVSIGDSIIFKHKYHYNLYIFKNQKAFNLCNFTQATLLTNPNTTSYTWHPSRPGYFLFTFNNGSFKACQGSQKLAIKVSTSSSSEEEASPPAPQPQGSANAPMEGAPGPSSGGEVSSSPSFPWPFRPGQAPALSPSGTVPLVPKKSGGGNGMPFINSNPAVPLPTGEVDSATIRPIPTSSAYQPQANSIRSAVMNYLLDSGIKWGAAPAVKGVHDAAVELLHTLLAVHAEIIGSTHQECCPKGLDPRKGHSYIEWVFKKELICSEC